MRDTWFLEITGNELSFTPRLESLVATL